MSKADRAEAAFVVGATLGALLARTRETEDVYDDEIAENIVKHIHLYRAVHNQMCDIDIADLIERLNEFYLFHCEEC